MLDPKLETLLTIYETQTFTRAAQKLSLSQPTISNHINLLEQQLGCSLCLRSKGRIVFTSAGEIAVKNAKRMKAVYTQLQSELNRLERNDLHIRIGMTRTTESDSVVASTIGKFTIQKLEHTISLISKDPEKLYEMLDNYELDVIIADCVPERPDISYRILDSANILCVVGKENPLSQKNSLTLEELKTQRMIMRPPSSSTRASFEAALLKENESIKNFNIILETNSRTMIRYMVRHSFAVSIMSGRDCIQDINKDSFHGLSIEKLNLKREIFLVYRTDFSNVQFLDTFQNLYNTSKFPDDSIH